MRSDESEHTSLDVCESFTLAAFGDAGNELDDAVFDRLAETGLCMVCSHNAGEHGGSRRILPIDDVLHLRAKVMGKAP
jgi:hypothetical protein